MQLKDLVSFPEAYESLKKIEMPFELAYNFSRLNIQVQQDLIFYQEKVTEILNENCLRDDSGNPKMSENGEAVLIRPDCIESCNAALNDLGSIEAKSVTIRIPLKDFQGFGAITPEMLTKLVPFIEA